MKKTFKFWMMALILAITGISSYALLNGSSVQYAPPTAGLAQKASSAKGAQLREGDAIAQVNGQAFTSVQAAVNAAEAGETVELMGDFTIDQTIKVNKAIVLNGGGHTATANVCAFELTNGATLQNVIIDQTGAPTAVDGISFTNAIQSATLNGVVAKGKSSASGYFVATNGGTYVLKNCNISGYNYAVQSDGYASNWTFDNCTFSNLGYGFFIGSSSATLANPETPGSVKFTNCTMTGGKIQVGNYGNIVYENNQFDGTCVGVGLSQYASDPKVVFTGNNMTNGAYITWKYAFATAEQNASYDITGNYWNGRAQSSNDDYGCAKDGYGPSAAVAACITTGSDLSAPNPKAGAQPFSFDDESSASMGYEGEALPEGPDMSGDVVNVNAANAQYVLDGAYGAIDGKTINFTESVNESLVLGRPTKYAGSNTEYRHGSFDNEAMTYDDFVAYKNQPIWTEYSYYNRAISNVTFTANDGVELKGFTAVGGAHIYGTATAPCYDYVRDNGKWCYDSNNGYYHYAVLKNFKFQGLTLTSKTDIATSQAKTVFDGFTFDGCKFNIGNTASGNQAIRYYNEGSATVKNLVVNNCEFKDVYQGVYTAHVENATITNNKVDGTGHNAFAFQNGTFGNLVITDNVITNCGDRALRFDVIHSTDNVTITGNEAQFKDGVTTTGVEECMKATAVEAGATITVENNNWHNYQPAANEQLQEVVTVAKIGETEYATLADAVAAAKAGDVVEIVKADTYKLPGIPANISIQGAVEGVVIDAVGSGSIASVPNGATFKDMTFNFGQSTYHGFQHAGTINMEGCTLNGLLISYGNMNFNKCKFVQTNKEYMMWCYGKDVTYTDCVFDGQGKFLNVYCESNTEAYNITVTGCKFISHVKNKAALNIKETCGSNLLKYNVTISNSTAEGEFPEPSGDITSSALYVGDALWQVDDRNANSIANTGITVAVNNEPIYPANTAVAKIGATDYATLAEALAAVKAGETIEVLVADTYTIPVSGIAGVPAGVTVKADVEGVVFDCKGTGSIANISNGIAFEGITFEMGQTEYHGFYHSGFIQYKNCVINGYYKTYGKTKFEGCTFNQQTYAYCLNAYGTDLDLVGCTFNNVGKAFYVYTEGNDPSFTVNVTDCEFNVNYDGQSKAKTQIFIKNNVAGQKYNVNINNCKLNVLGETDYFDKSVDPDLTNGNGDVRLWNVEEGSNTNTTVFVNLENKKVYPITYVAQIGDVKYVTLQAAVDAAQAGETITVIEDIDLDKTVAVNKAVTIDMNGHKVTNTTDLWDKAPGDWSLISVREGGDLTITGEGSLLAKANDCYALDVQDEGVKLTVNINGDVVGNISAIYAHTGSVVVNSGNYSIIQKTSGNDPDKFLLNCFDANCKNGTATISVKGGTYTGFNPEDNVAEGAGTNFVAEGYESVDNGDGTWTVIPERLRVAQIGDVKYLSLADALLAVPADGTETTIKILADIDLGTKGATIPATKNVVLDLNGKTITSAATSTIATFNVSGKLLVKGEGTILSTTNYAVKLANNAAVVTLESGTLKSTAANKTTVYSTNSGLFTMIGGAIESAYIAVDVKNANISGGTITAQKWGVNVAGETTITGGNISGNEAAVRIYTGNVKVTDATLNTPIKFAPNATGLVLNGTTAEYDAELAVYDGETLLGYATAHTSAAIANGKSVKVVKDITTDTPMNVAATTFDLNGHNITSTAQTAIQVTGTSASSARNLVITGEGNVNCDNGGACNAVRVDKFSTVTIKGGNYTVGGDADNAAIYIFESKTTSPSVVNISGGTFKNGGDGKFLINCKDDARTTGANFIITGGTYTGFNPEDNVAEGAGTNFVAEGYESVDNGDGTWTVIPERLRVAQIGDVKYVTLQAAVDAAQAGETITIIEDIDLDKTVAVNKAVTIDMNGHKVTNTTDLWDKAPCDWSLISVREGGDLTITGEGSLLAKANDCYALDVQDEGVNLTVNIDGDVVGNISAIYAHTGSVVVNSGNYSIIQKTSGNDPDRFLLNCYDANRKNGTATISVKGGTFAGFNPEDNVAEGAGTNFVAEGYESVDNGDGTWTVMPVRPRVAQIGDVKYLTLADAVAAVPADGTETTIKMIDDHEMSTYVRIPAGKNVVLDLNGKQVSAPSQVVVPAGKLTVTDNSDDASGAIVSKGNTAIHFLDGGDVTIEKGNIRGVEGAVVLHTATNVKLTVNGGYLTASDNAVISANGSKGAATSNVITINGGKIEGNIKTAGYIACGIYLPNNTELNMNGGEIVANGGCGILVRAGIVNINDGTITTTGSAVGKVGDSRVVVPCAAVVFDQEANYPGLTADAAFNISGGQFASEVETVQTIPASEASRVNISGGIFSSEVNDVFCVAGYKPAANTDAATNSMYPYTVNAGNIAKVYPGNANVMTDVSVTEWESIQASAPNAVAFVDADMAGWAETQTNVVIEYNAGKNGKYYECPNFVLTDLKDFYTPVNFTAVGGSYDREINADYATCCVPFALKTSDIDAGAKLLSYAYYENKGTASNVYFSANSTVGAGVPCFIFDRSHSGIHVEFANTQIVAEPVVNASNMKGTFVKTTEFVQNGYYGVSTAGATLARAQGYTSAFRSALALSYTDAMAGGSKAPQLRIVIIGDGTTGVDALYGEKEVSSVVYYNAAGMTSDEPFDGINIVVVRYTDGSMNSSKFVK